MGLRSDVSIASRLRSWALPAGLAAVAVAAQAAGIAGAWRYERAGLAAGEWWRLVTGHAVHLGWSHVVLNLAGLGLVWLLVGSALGALEWGLVLAASLVAMDAGFWFLAPGLAWYVGLSGLLHGLLAAGLLVSGATWPDRRVEAIVLGGLVAAKLAWETGVGPLPGSVEASGGPVVVAAHLYGAVGGVAGGALVLIRRRAGH